MPTAWRCLPWTSSPGLWPGLRPWLCRRCDRGRARDALARGANAVWAPYALISGRSDVEESWRLTSDSLALWLAARLGAERCYLIKSIARSHTRLAARQLARDGVVDQAFAGMLEATRVTTILLGRGDQQAFAEALADGSTPCGAALD